MIHILVYLQILSMIMPHSILQEKKNEDEKFPVNFNDVEYCARIHRAGYRILQCNSAVQNHYESKTRRTSVERWELKQMKASLGDLLVGEDPFTPGVRAPAAPRRSIRSRVAARLARGPGRG